MGRSVWGIICVALVAACTTEKVAKEIQQTVPEPPGANCPNGGEVTQTGIDTNGDGILEPGEVQSTSYTCDVPSPPAPPPMMTLDGSYTIRNALDIAALDGFTAITGDLDIDANGMTAIDVPTLQSVGGTITMENNTTVTELSFADLTTAGAVAVPRYSNAVLATISFPHLAMLTSTSVDSAFGATTTVDLSSLASAASALRVDSGGTASLGALQTVQGALYVGEHSDATALNALVSVGGAFGAANTTATSFAFPSLQTVGGDLSMTGDDLATTISFPTLQTVGGTLTVSQMRALTSLMTPALRSVTGDLVIDYDNDLIAVDVPQLTQVGGSFEPTFDPALTTLSAPALQTVGKSLNLDDDSALGALSFDALTSTTSLFVTDNAALTSLAAPLLTIDSVWFQVSDNPQLPTCQVTALLAQISPKPQATDTSGDSASCP